MASPGAILAQMKMHKASLEVANRQQNADRIQRSMAMLTRVGMQFQQMRQEKQLLAQRGQQTAALQKQAQAGRLATGKEVATFTQNLQDPQGLKKKKDAINVDILNGKPQTDAAYMFAGRPDLTTWGKQAKLAQMEGIKTKQQMDALQLKEQKLINQYKAIKNEQESPFGQARAAALGAAKDFIGNLGKAKRQVAPGLVGQYEEAHRLATSPDPTKKKAGDAALKALNMDVRKATASVNASNVKILSEFISAESGSEGGVKGATKTAKFTASAAVVRGEMAEPGTYDSKVYQSALTIFMGGLDAGAEEALKKMPEGPKKEEFKAAIKKLVEGK